LQVIAAEVLVFLREGGDEVARGDAARSLCDLAERYAPDHRWFVDTMNELFEAAGKRATAAAGNGHDNKHSNLPALAISRSVPYMLLMLNKGGCILPSRDTSSAVGSVPQARWCLPAWLTT
jgi:hypothetical protein